MTKLKVIEPFVLENGAVIENLEIAYSTFGKLNNNADNVVWVSHALTANSNVCEWWEGLFGPASYFDPEEFFIVCPNILGSCYGTTGPSTPQPGIRPLLDQFPLITTRDMAAVHERLRLALGIERIQVLIGASIGGQQALEWSIAVPDVVEQLILIATNAQHSPFAIAFNESQRWAIEKDPSYGKQINGGKEGLALARSIAMLSYRSYEGYNLRQEENDLSKVERFRAATYQRYQGKKLSDRFSAYSYVTLTKAMDAHNVGRGRGSAASALSLIRARTLVLGISSDILFPTSEQHFLQNTIKNAFYDEIDSEFGHDGFLIETEKLTERIRDFLENDFRKYRPTIFKQRLKQATFSIN